MSAPKRKILYLVVEGLPADQRPPETAEAEIFILNESTAPAALEKIFSSDAVSVWSEIKP